MNDSMMRQDSLRPATTGHPTDRAETSTGNSGPLMDADQAVRSFVAERPFAAVIFALAAGYVIGRAINAAR
jgi:hypothetical protein